MKKIFIVGFRDGEIYACPFCFHQVADYDNYCSSCGGRIDDEGTIDTIDDFKVVIKKLENDK